MLLGGAVERMAGAFAAAAATEDTTAPGDEQRAGALEEMPMTGADLTLGGAGAVLLVGGAAALAGR
ncbi:hypothetical protein JSY14_05390 [Brachybacterium sp. EF45031]|uniref:hypothetical protein n=1 Tax=Brachybacterium sillae TaxID=2810536 RepID=UPI00217CE412|nr:hypothetical protein [Brachybacterium sillae]MCS6711485.1 hypothetical protein [Brachybacterium sillae]